MCISEILNLKTNPKNRKYAKDLDELIDKIKALPEVLTISDIINLWGKNKSSNAKSMLEPILKYEKKIMATISGINIHNPDIITLMKKSLFPQSRYKQPTDEINFGMKETITSVKSLHEELKSLIAELPANKDMVNAVIGNDFERGDVGIIADAGIFTRARR